MGVIRLILALSVLLNHTWPDAYLLASGRIPVQLFFIISGFLISYILVEKNFYTSIFDFYINRILRIYPLYIFIATLTFLYYFNINKTDFFNLYNILPEVYRLYFYISNLTLLFQDLVYFFDLNPVTNDIFIQYNLLNSNAKLYNGLLLPQAWSVSLELSFYLLAPYILFNKNIIIMILIFSIFIRVFLLYIGIGTIDPWVYRFFPTEIMFFLCGVLSHQILKPFYLNNIYDLKKYSYIATIFILLFISFYYNYTIIEPFKNIFLFTLFLLFLPLIFIFDNYCSISRYLGKLSFPIYISHFLFYLMFSYYIDQLTYLNISILVLITSIIFSIFSIYFIDNKIEIFRNKFRNK